MKDVLGVPIRLKTAKTLNDKKLCRFSKLGFTCMQMFHLKHTPKAGLALPLGNVLCDAGACNISSPRLV